MTDYPDIDTLVPHARPMLLLDRVLQSAPEKITCAVTVRDDALFSKDGSVPALLGIEYMAQTVAAFSGLRAARANEATRIGFLLGTRSFTSNCSHIRCGTTLTVTAHQAVQGSEGMAAFECSVEGPDILQEAILTVYEPKNPSGNNQGDPQ